MAISTDPSVLAAASRCFDTCIPPGDQYAVKTYLLALMNGGSTDPAVLLQNAKCWISCIPPGAQAFVQAYLATIAAGESTDPSTAANAARCFMSCIPPGENNAVENYALANSAGGSTDPATIANQARCFSSCISPSFQLGVQTYLLGVAAGITDPATALTGAGGLIGTVPPGLGNGIRTVGIIKWAGKHGGSVTPTTPTGFAFASNIAFTSVVASWDVPATGLATEIWTSSDNITFTLNQTVAGPLTTGNVTIPAIGSTTYCKIRWTTPTAQSAFTSVLQFTHTDWETRAAANSGNPIGTGSKAVQNNFYSAMANQGILTKMLAVGFFDFQSGGHLLICLTPIVKVAGSDPWGQVNMGDGMVGANGVTATGGSGVGATSGVLGTGFPSDANGGMTIYAITGNEVLNAYALGYGNNAGTIGAAIQIKSGGNFLAKMWNDTSGLSGASPGAGYYSLNRIAANDLKLYYAKTATPHGVLASSALASGSRAAQSITYFALNAYELGSPEFGTINNTLACIALHQGLTAAESAKFFSILSSIQAFTGGLVP